MQYGKWELRNDAKYWLSSKANIFPSSNAVDEGKLNSEENVRNIYRDIVDKNYVLQDNYFNIKANPEKTGVILSPGEAVICGYHFKAMNELEIYFPNDGNNVVTPYTLGISLSYDAGNHVLGDIVNTNLHVGESEVLSGVYVSWFNDCEIECSYKNILILGRAWVINGKLINTPFRWKQEESGDNRIIYNALEVDPHKKNKIDAQNIEVDIYGHDRNDYDTIPDNISSVYSKLKSYDSSLHNVFNTTITKPPLHTSDIQDYISHTPDWYTSKYGDYMTGALRFNNMSIDAMREYYHIDNINKDEFPVEFGDSVFISPRTYGDLLRHDDSHVQPFEVDGEEITDLNYNVGGTIMSIVPGTYTITDKNNGFTGIHAALISQKYGNTGLMLHAGDGNETSRVSYTRLTHYNSDDSFDYKKEKYENTNKFIIENVDENGKKASINIKNGEIFIDSYTDEPENVSYSESLDGITGYYTGSGFNVRVGATNKINNVAYKFGDTFMKMYDAPKHRFEYNDERVSIQLGLPSDNQYFSLGNGISYNVNEISVDNSANKNQYLKLGNLRFRSIIENENYHKLNVVDSIKSDMIPYIYFKTGLYGENIVSEKNIQIGSIAKGNYIRNNVKDSYCKISMSVEKPYEINSRTVVEQSIKDINDNLPKVFNKLVTPEKISDYDNESYSSINGIFSMGNIGCSDKILNGIDSDSNTGDDNAYTPNNNWVRFTRYGVNNDLFNSTDAEKMTNSYNIEFNTINANDRQNQLVWHYRGNDNPLTLSYIHDESTIYSDSNPEYETYVNHNGFTQYNPSHKIRDFLYLENGGLVVSGDINNPSIAGDTLNSSNRFGTTIVNGRVYNAVWNDFAETFEKKNKDEIAKPGDLISLDPETGKYEVCNISNTSLIVGVQSSTYAYLAGGNRVDRTQDIIDLENEYFTVAVAGKVWVNVVEFADIHIGDLLCSSIIRGKATKSYEFEPGTIIGKALSEPTYYEDENEFKVLMLVMTA